MMMDAKKTLLFIGLLFSASLCAAFESYHEVIASDDFVSLHDAEQKVLLPTEATINANLQAQQEKLRARRIRLDNLMDNQGSTLSVGKVKDHPLALNHPLHAFFIMNDDPHSLAWVNDNKDYLKSIHAVGLMVDCKNIEILENLEKQLGLAIVPANLTDVSAILDTNHYPVLVANHWVTQ